MSAEQIQLNRGWGLSWSTRGSVCELGTCHYGSSKGIARREKDKHVLYYSLNQAYICCFGLVILFKFYWKRATQYVKTDIRPVMIGCAAATWRLAECLPEAVGA
jgi:hypothetical protein